MVRWVALLGIVVIAAAGGWYFLTLSKAKKFVATDREITGKILKSKGVGGGAKSQDARPITRKSVDTGLSSGIGFSPDSAYEKGELLVVNPPRNFEEGASVLGFSVAERLNLVEMALVIYRMRIPQGMTVPQARSRLASKFPGLTTDANHHFEAQGTAQAQGGFAKLNARAAIGWRPATPNCGAGIKIGMIDSAVDTTHPALKGRNVVFRSFHGRGRGPGPATHGTAVAAMLVGNPQWGGLLPGAALRAGNMFEEKATGQVVGSAVGLLKSIDWMIKEQVHVINLSVAGADNKVVRLAMKKTKEKGISMVAAAGNWGKNGKPAYPAAYVDVLAVTAFGGAERTIYAKANQGKYIDFAAPGVQIWTAVPGGGRYQSGTSFAAPYVSVFVALLSAGGTAKSAAALRKVLNKRILDLGPKGKDNIYGWGLVNLEPKCT